MDWTRGGLLGAAMLSGTWAIGAVALAQSPIPPPVVPGHHHHAAGPGPIARAAHHAGFVVKDRMIGYHDQFAQPPLGFFVEANYRAQAARADTHRWTLYRTDFWADSDRLTPNGAARLARMASRSACWGGPLLVEVVPDRPGLAERRRDAVASALAQAGTAIGPDRLVVGLSPYLGLRGDLAGGPSVIGGYDGLVLDRSLAAPAALSLSPVQPAAAGLNPGSSGGQ